MGVPVPHSPTQEFETRAAPANADSSPATTCSNGQCTARPAMSLPTSIPRAPDCKTHQSRTPPTNTRGSRRAQPRLLALHAISRQLLPATHEPASSESPARRPIPSTQHDTSEPTISKAVESPGLGQREHGLTSPKNISILSPLLVELRSCYEVPEARIRAYDDG